MSHPDLLDLSRRSGPLYAPTPFWAEGARRLAEDIDANGIENFRNKGAPLNFFVPTYGYPGNSLSDTQITALRAGIHPASAKQSAIVENWLTGHDQARVDYRVFAAAAQQCAPYLMAFSESDAGNPREHFNFQGRQYSRSALNYLIALTFLAQFADLEQCHTFLEIGGGFGTLGEILAKTREPETYRFIDVDIPPTCEVADYYLGEACRETERMTSAAASLADNHPIDDLPPLTVLPNWQIEALSGRIDVFVNFFSFQEMEPEVVASYLEHVDRLEPKWILLRNMREGKQVRTADDPIGVTTPIKGPFYAEQLPNYALRATDADIFGSTTADGFHSDLSVFERV
ncbi:putative sugar O-methyltransferase [uncultured Roseibium sp.]|uniref:putative sugar O-methyltransferase n=1 Tax=uncultured Roseibium sp. TaxID=1936171 RepID=UPI003216BFA0